jgi:hypothetical protein
VPIQPLALAAIVVVTGLAASWVVEALEGPRTLIAGLRLLALGTVPGLIVVLVAERRSGRDAAHGLVFALALSPIVFVIGSLAASEGFGLSLGAGARLCAVLASLGAIGASLPGLFDRRWGASSGRPSLQAPWLLFAPSLALGAGALVVWANPGARVSYHGVLHAGFVAQLVQGTIPPENPALAGAPAGFYWLYHWLLAAWGEVASVSILETSAALNLVALTVYVSASVLLLRRFLRPRTAAWAALACGFAVNLLVPVVFAARWALDGAPSSPFVWPFEFLRGAWLGGDPRLVTLFAKFLNVNGFPVGLALFALLLEELAPPHNAGRPRPWIIVLLLVGLGLFHPTTAAGAYAALGGAVAICALGDLPGHRLSWLWRRILPVGLSFALALALTSPYLFSVASAATELVHGPRGGEIGYGARGLALSATPLLLVVLSGARRCWRDPMARFLLVSTVILLALGALLPLPDGNQYKLTLMASLPGGVLLFWCVGEPRGRPLARTLLSGAVALAIGGHILTVVAYQRSAMAGRTLHAGEVGYLSVPGDPPLDRALHWLRDSTLPEAVVISKPVRFGGAMVTPVSARSDFVLLGGHHTRGDPRFGRRIALVRRLFDPQEPIEPLVVELGSELDRPLYVLVRRQQFPDAFDALLERFERTRTLRNVFADHDLRIFAIETAPSP